MPASRLCSFDVKNGGGGRNQSFRIQNTQQQHGHHKILQHVDHRKLETACDEIDPTRACALLLCSQASRKQWWHNRYKDKKSSRQKNRQNA